MSRTSKKDETNFEIFCSIWSQQGSLVFGANCSLPYKWRKYVLKWNAELARYVDQSRGGLITIYGKREFFVDELMTWDRWCAFWNRQGFRIIVDKAQLPEEADFGLSPKSWTSKKHTRQLCKEEKETLAFIKESMGKLEEMQNAVETEKAKLAESGEILLNQGLPAEEAKDQQSQQPPAEAHDEQALPLVSSE